MSDEGGGARPAPKESASDEDTFVGYHGTSSVFVRAIQQGIAPLSGRNFDGETQLGTGFYTTPDSDTARTFAERAVQESGGTPAVVEVYARGYGLMVGRTVPRRLWWDIPDDSLYVTDFDYLAAPVAGYEAVDQVKFNPRAYGALRVRISR